MVLPRRPSGWQAPQRRPGSLSRQPILSTQRLPTKGLPPPPCSVLCKGASPPDSRELHPPLSAGKALGRVSSYSAAGAGRLMQASGNPIRSWGALLSIPGSELAEAAYPQSVVAILGSRIAAVLAGTPEGVLEGALPQLAACTGFSTGGAMTLCCAASCCHTKSL